jgi:hypothetical protein
MARLLLDVELIPHGISRNVEIKKIANLKIKCKRLKRWLSS